MRSREPFESCYVDDNNMYRQKRRTFRPMMRLLFPPERRPRLRALPLGLDLAKCAIRF